MKQIEIQYRTFRLKDDDRTFFCTQAKCDYNLNVLGIAYIAIRHNTLPSNWNDKTTWLHLPNGRLKDIIIPKDSASLNGAYTPAAEMENGLSLQVLTPDSMDESTAEALRQLKKAVGNVAEFVAERLQYSMQELSEVLALEQIDAVALAIYNAEARNQGLIVGDQTGIGKGRVAAAFIRYGVVQGHKPIFFTEKPGLFCDIYRDLCDIHCETYKPLIVNSEGGNIMDKDGNDVYIYSKKTLENAISANRVPNDCHFVCCTYSQLSGDNKNKRDFIAEISINNIVILDEAHNAGGEVTMNKSGEITGGNTGYFFQTNVLATCKGVLYLSATYAKKPKNMPIYALNTCISDITGGTLDKASLSKKTDIGLVTELSEIKNYFMSLPAQEIISSSMARFGQFIRRERKTEGMNVDYYTLDESAVSDGFHDLKAEHWSIYRNITEIYARIRRFQEVYFLPYLQDRAKELAAGGNRTQKPPTVASASLFSSLFHLTNNILLSMKAIPVAERAIQHIRDGKAVVIALADTNESVLKNRSDAGKSKSKNEDDVQTAIEVSEGQRISGDYTLTFDNIFKNLFYYNIRKGREIVARVDIPVEDLGSEAVEEYHEILKLFRNTTSGLCFSPIDVIRERIEREGYKTAECTGRSLRLSFKDGDYLHSTIVKADKYATAQGKHVSMCYNEFNNNKVDCLIINQSGSTGKSAHATNKGTRLRAEQVKQRVMLIAQAELDVNTEVQKRGRINRTGQFTHIPPQYEYIFSAIPCEKRFMMMLKAKLKSLDANTTSNQKQSDSSVLQSDDFFNKYGDAIVEKLLENNYQLNHVLNDPLAQEADPINPKRKKQKPDEMALTVFGRMQVLPPEEQEKYYNEVLTSYNTLVAQLKAEDKFDLEMKEADFQAKRIAENILSQKENDGTHSELMSSSFITKYSIKQQSKFMSVKDITEMVNRNIQSGLADTDKILKKLKSDYDDYTRKETENHNERLKEAIERQDEKVNSLTKLVEEYIENELPQDSIARCRERLKEASDKLKELKAAKDTEWDEKMAKRKDLYETLKTLIGKARVGYYFAYNDNIYCVTQISLANEDANIYSAPSNINIKLACTDPLNNKGLDLNFAETGMNYLLELTRKKSDERSYDSFIKNDTRREEVSIITGNIVPYLSEQGIVITRYTLADGSMENGIVVKPVLRDGILQMPDYCKYATIPLNTKTIKPISKSLTSESRVYFRNIAYHGQFYIEGRRYGDYMHFFLGADAGYKNFLANEEVLDCLRTNDKIPYRNGIFSIEIPDVDSLLSIMTKHQFSAQINFSAIDSYADALDFSKYKPKDWAKLSYDRNKIPTDYKGHKAQNTSISALLLAEMALISESDTLEVEIIDYSEKSWAVIGGSKREWTILKNAGAKYNSHLSVGAGWILPKSKYTKAQILKLVA